MDNTEAIGGEVGMECGERRGGVAPIEGEEAIAFHKAAYVRVYFSTSDWRSGVGGEEVAKRKQLPATHQPRGTMATRLTMTHCTSVAARRLGVALCAMDLCGIGRCQSGATH